MGQEHGLHLGGKLPGDGPACQRQIGAAPVADALYPVQAVRPADEVRAVGGLVDVWLPPALRAAGAPAVLADIGVAPFGELPAVDAVHFVGHGVAAALHNSRPCPFARGPEPEYPQLNAVFAGYPLLTFLYAGVTYRNAGRFVAVYYRL